MKKYIAMLKSLTLKWHQREGNINKFVETIVQ